MQSINYIGVARLTVAFTAEAVVGVSKLYGQFIELADAEKAKLYAAIPHAEETVSLLKKAAILDTPILTSDGSLTGESEILSQTLSQRLDQ